MSQMVTLVEETYDMNLNESVILLCHSMGCPLMLYFLNRQPQAWKDKYIRSLYTLGGPWGGAVKSVKAFASGDNFGVIVVPSLTIRDDERTFPSLAYLLPNSNAFSPDQVLVQTNQRNYTVADYRDFFTDINYEVGYNMWADVSNLTRAMEPPGVEVVCIHGVGFDTMSQLIYNKNHFPDEQPDDIVYADGDGTVNIESLSACRQWIGQQEQPVLYKPVKGLDHMLVMSDVSVMRNLAQHAITRASNKQR